MNKILQTISLQDYVERLWNHSNTKIPVTIGKETDTAKPRSKAPYTGQWIYSHAIVWYGMVNPFIFDIIYICLQYALFDCDGLEYISHYNCGRWNFWRGKIERLLPAPRFL